MTNPLLRLLPIIARHKFSFFWTIASNSISQIGVLALALISAVLASEALRSPSPPVVVVGGILVIIALTTAAMTWLESWVSHDLAYRLIGELRDIVFAALRRSLPERSAPRRSGDLVTVAFTDVDKLEWLYAHTIAQTLTGLMMLLVTTFLSILLSPLLLLVWIPLMLVTAALPWLFGTRGEKEGAELGAANAALNADVIETVHGLRELTGSNALTRRRRSLAERTQTLGLIQTRIGARVGVERAIADAALALSAIGALAIAGTTIDAFFAPVALVLATAALGPIAQISDLLRNLGSLVASSRRIVELTDRPSLASEPQTPGGLSQTGSGLEFRNVSFRYGDQDRRLALDSVSFHIRPGEKVALVGASGAGKSTCAMLAMRMWDPTAGTILVDGSPLDRITDDELRSTISAVPQGLGLLSGTIESNIRLGNPRASDRAVSRAAEQAGIFNRASGLQFGLETKIGENGTGLSGGQRARVAIARALLTNPRVLVLDEATASLDADADAAIAEMLSLNSDRATLVIAHRQDTIARCDRVITLSNGIIQQS